jgi:Tfp pilus assembly PilM family ATPase
VVLPSVLAALGQVDASVPTLVIKIDMVTTSVAIVDQDRLLLVRTLDNPVGARPDPEQLAEDAYPSLEFYQDTYGTKVQRILVNGIGALDGLSTAIEEHTGIRAQELVSAAQIDSASSKYRAVLGGVVGALALNS